MSLFPMASRRRKKPPDPLSASLLSSPCYSLRLDADLPLSSHHQPLPSSYFSHCPRDGGVSTPDLPTTGRLGPTTMIWVATHLANDAWSIVHCSSVWHGTSIRPSRGSSLKITVRAVILHHTGMPQRLPSDSFGKRFGYISSASTTHEYYHRVPAVIPTEARHADAS
uniref:Uncharacterized protein n=1 Tax=Opuntia streptacantha TaxID=393608 RepID=A0A7C9CQB4_OPUST